MVEDNFYFNLRVCGLFSLFLTWTTGLDGFTAFQPGLWFALPFLARVSPRLNPGSLQPNCFG